MIGPATYTNLIPMHIQAILSIKLDTKQQNFQLKLFNAKFQSL